jgi:itaconate CoA-transferase
MPGALDGILVVTLEQAVAAPFLSSRLADAGARVIKIERAEGDFARYYDSNVMGQSAYFVWLNRGKESIVLDIKQPGDAALLNAMLAKADVWIQNLAPGAMERAGFGSADLRRRHPRLITVDISGYGEVGPPYDSMKAYDLLVQAESGIASVTGSAVEPGRIGISATDIGTGMFAHAAVLQALYGRERTGKGAGIKGSLFASMADWMAAPLLYHEYAGKGWPRMALGHPTLVPYGAYQTGDGKLTLVACQSQREWVRFCAHVLERPELAEATGMATPVERAANRAQVDQAINAVLGTLTQEALRDRLRKADIAFGSVNSVPELSQHPALRRITYATPAGPVTVSAPGSYNVDDEPHYGAVPTLDQHGALLRKEFGQ